MESIDFLKMDLMSEINISIGASVAAMACSALAALILRNLYISYGRSMNNRAYFGNIFILLSVTTCAVIIIVKYSLALSLGLVGALSIVRFRAAIKEPEELVFLFMTIAFGLSFGSNQFVIGFILLATGSVIIILSDYFISNSAGSDTSGIIAVIEGDKMAIQGFRQDRLAPLLSKHRAVSIKEVSYDDHNGRIVVRSHYLDGVTEEFFRKLEEISFEDDLRIQILSDVTVPF